MEFRSVDPTEWRDVLALMREFYPLEGLVLDESLAAQALQWVLADSKRGAIFLFRLDGETLGYCALTAGVSLVLAIT